MILSIDEVNDILDEIAEGFPEVLFDELNGGINLLEITPDGAKLLYDREMDEVLMGFMGYYKFALIRPTMA